MVLRVFQPVAAWLWMLDRRVRVETHAPPIAERGLHNTISSMVFV